MDLRQKLEAVLQDYSGSDLKAEMQRVLSEFPASSSHYVLEKFSAYFQQSDDLFVVFEPDLAISYINDSAATAMEVDDATSPVRSLAELVGADASRAVESYVRKTLDLGERVYAVHKLRTKGGTRLYDSVFTPVKSKGGDVVSVVMVAREVRRRPVAVPLDRQDTEVSFPDSRSVSANDLESYTNDLKVLHDLLAAPGQDIERIYSAYLAAGLRMFGTHSGVISRIHGRAYTVLAVEGEDKGSLLGARFNLDQTYCSQVIRFKHSIHTSNVREDTEFSSLRGHCGLPAHTYFGAPIWVDGMLYGSINFFSREPRDEPFTEQDVEALEIMANGIGRTLTLQMERKETDRFFQISPDMLGLLDLDGTLLRFNHSWSHLLGYDSDDLFEMPCLDLVHPNDRDEARQGFAKLLETSETVLTFDCRMQRADGTYRWVEWNAASSEHDNTVAVHLRDISERRQLEDELRVAHQDLAEARHELDKLSSADALTGIANLRRFNNFYQQEWHRAVRYGTPLSVVLVDIDDFAMYNEIYGHPQGDEVLRQIALDLSHGVYRPGDIVARLGSEEFGLVLADTDEDGSRFVAEQIMDRIRSLGITHKGSSTGDILTVSIGVATAQPYTGIARDILIEEATSALATAKEQGKNCMVGVVNTSIVMPPEAEESGAEPARAGS